MTAVEKKVNDFAKVLIGAKEYAQKFANTEDGGCCNFDAPKVYLPGWSRKSVETACKKADMVCFDHKFFRNSERGWVICGGTSGQGNRRSRMAEAMQRFIKANGYNCMMYYQCD